MRKRFLSSKVETINNLVNDGSAKQASKNVLRPNNFDLIRLLAALQVVLFHSIHHLGIQADYWFVDIFRYLPGVPIFFFMSGLMVSASYERNSDTKRYAVNRLFRIYPGLWVCFLVGVISVLIFGSGQFGRASHTSLASWVFAQLTLFQFYNPSFLRDYGNGVLNGSLWTIPIELQFYVALPLTYWITGTPGAKKGTIPWQLWAAFLFFLGICAVFFSFRFSNANDFWFKMIQCSMLPHFWLFLLGVLVQRKLVVLKKYFAGKLLVWLCVHVVVCVVASQLGSVAASNIPGIPVSLSLACVTLSAAFTLSTMSDFLLRHNDLSYGVYIYHVLVINALIELKIVGGWHAFWITLILTLLLATASWKLVEFPMIQLKKRMSKPAKPTPKID